MAQESRQRRWHKTHKNTENMAQEKTQETEEKRRLPLPRFVRHWVHQRLCSHRFDYSDLVGRPTPDGCVTWPCYKCGKLFVRQCGLNVLHHGQVGNKPNV
jgi:hypothetical protein